MKKLFFTLSLMMCAVFALQAQDAAKSVENGPEITLNKEVHDYGTIKQNANGASEFKITNTGNEPLVISRAKGSCGCTVPEWPKEPIMPGESAVMTVRYDTKRQGPINKSVTITSNAVNAPTKVVRIKGNVLPSTASSDAPLKDKTGTPAVVD